MNPRDRDIQTRTFFNLVLRSKDQGDGWRNVSAMLRYYVTACVARDPDLYETREQESGMQIRFSEEGLIVVKHMGKFA